MPQSPTFSHVIPVASLPRGGARKIALIPDPAQLALIRDALDLQGLRKVALRGTLSPEGARDWRLDATLGATVVQPCVVTLAPVTTRIDEKVTRIWRAEMAEPDPTLDEVEIPEQVDEEPLGRSIDLGAVLVEALALALPAWPRAPGAHLDEAVFAAPGVTPMRDQDARPFAALAGLRASLPKDDSPDEESS